MGYTIKIGQAVLEVYGDTYIVSVEDVEHPNAPAFGEPTDYTNARWPSYTAWSRFILEAGLDLHLIGEDHPGNRVITEELYQTVKHSLDTVDFKNPHNLNRAIWLEYWMRWALDNCDNPIITNG